MSYKKETKRNFILDTFHIKAKKKNTGITVVYYVF